MKKFLILFLISFFLFSCDLVRTYKVNYEVSGTAEDVTVSYINGSGDIINHNIILPWSKTVDVAYGNKVGISTGNIDGIGYMTVKVTYEGQFGLVHAEEATHNKSIVLYGEFR